MNKNIFEIMRSEWSSTFYTGGLVLAFALLAIIKLILPIPYIKKSF